MSKLIGIVGLGPVGTILAAHLAKGGAFEGLWNSEAFSSD